MEEIEWLTERFQQHRSHLRGVAYRMLGSVSEADDALQEAWLRIRDQDRRSVENMQAWLTTIVGRVCLNMLRARRARRHQFTDVYVPDPVVSLEGSVDPEQEALVADSVGLALLVVLDALTPPERLAFVLHDVFACRLRTSRRSSTVPKPPRSNSPAELGDACTARPRRTRTSGDSARSSTRSSPPLAMATLTPWWRCSIPMSNCGSIAACCARKRR
jgi:RNA polymerase sigma factor (sigma-70 family)